ncbi:MAG TPA: glycosyltransferase [Gammaproteobacteria bacterium]|nr:glycosyltransferase [Gammaproteobacteria bacterium]HPI95946.1 glycosyltransferase [Gammaproteobacteria bacterium]HPQ87475.1 glycosyltransferase [Gammaproteobacteria bacterium]
MKNPAPTQINQKSIVLHDMFDIKGGGERLVITLTNAIQADLCYGKHSNNSFPLDILHPDLIQYNLNLNNNLPGIRSIFLARLFQNKTQFLKNYQNAIYSGVTAPLAVKNHPNGKNLFYCHTPPRFIYDKFDYYQKQFPLSHRIALNLLIKWLKPRYEQAVNQMDVIFANSKFVQQRIQKYLNKDSIVVHPPCDTEKFYFSTPQDYYLSTGRLDSLKRIDKIIEAFKQMPKKKLVICSSGAEENKLRQLAKGYSNIRFTGPISDNKLKRIIANSIATIYIPEDEDFGISPVESMAAGKPVICSGIGGPTETIVNGENGLYIDEENIVESLIDCVNKLDINTAIQMQKACEERAELFNEKKFIEGISQYL